MMRFPMTVLRVVTLAPALLVSFVLTVVVCALLPPALGLVAFLVAAGLLVALALGQFEVPAIATLTLSRLATEVATNSAELTSLLRSHQGWGRLTTSVQHHCHDITCGAPMIDLVENISFDPSLLGGAVTQLARPIRKALR